MKDAPRSKRPADNPARQQPAPWSPRDLADSLVPRAGRLGAEQRQGLEAENRRLRTENARLQRRDQTINFAMDRLDHEMRLAARLQQDFLPKTLPRVGPVGFEALFRPAGHVSGDLYDVMRLDEEHVGFFIVDAVGHGMPAALLTMFIKRTLVAKEIAGNSYRLLQPHQAMQGVNQALLDQNLSWATFATAIYGVVNVRSLDLAFCCAGHPPPLLIRDGTLESLEGAGALLGIFPDAIYTTSTAQLRPGDRLLAYSDGIEIAFAGDQTGSARRWRQELLARRSMTAGKLLADFALRLDREAPKDGPGDDITAVLLEVAPALQSTHGATDAGSAAPPRPSDTPSSP